MISIKNLVARRIAANIAKLLELLGQQNLAELPNSEVDERTNSLGLFNSAEAYRLSAIALQLENIAHGHAHTPVRMLYHHAIELYLKALLRQKYSVTVLTKRFRHDIKRMTKEAEKLGLTPTDEDREVFSVLTETNAFIEARYIITGSKMFVTFEALNRTCDSLREGVSRILRNTGVMIRLKRTNPR